MQTEKAKGTFDNANSNTLTYYAPPHRSLFFDLFSFGSADSGKSAGGGYRSTNLEEKGR